MQSIDAQLSQASTEAKSNHDSGIQIMGEIDDNPGPEVIKYSCSTELSMKFQMLISIRNQEIQLFFQTQISLKCYFSCS